LNMILYIFWIKISDLAPISGVLHTYYWGVAPFSVGGHQIIGALPQSPLCQAFSLTGEDGTWSFYCQPEGLTQQSDGQRPSELANHTTKRWATSIGIEN